MADQLHSASKNEFQLKRISFFSDAVFAIAITLLAIDIKVPQIDKASPSDGDLVRALINEIPKFVGFLISFLLIGVYWIVHHRLFGYVTNYTSGLVWLNLLFLFTVVIMPFSTSFFSEYVGKNLVTPVAFYAFNIILLGLSNILIWRYVGDPANHVSEGLTKQGARFFAIRAIVFPLVCVITAFVYLAAPRVAIFIPWSLLILLRLFSQPKKISGEPNQKTL